MVENEKDPYARVDYRRLIAWESRIEREGPWLRQLVEGGPDPSVLDLGCGTGEHVAWCAGEGWRAVGIDSARSMIEKAQDHARRGRGRFLLGDAREAATLVADEPKFGLALCLGNMLPHLDDETAVADLLAAARAVLAPEGTLLIQLLNYERILEGGVRHLPLNFRTGDDGTEEIVFLRLLRPVDDGRILFLPTTLSVRPESDPPVTVVASRAMRLRAWTRAALEPRFAASGFTLHVHGDLQGGAFDAGESHDLVLRAVADG